VRFDPQVRVQKPAPLTRTAVAEVVQRALGERGDEVLADACTHATAAAPGRCS
jgi:hypothetical protein